MWPSFPYVLGSDGAGVVVAAGAHVTRFTPGDEVYGSGFFNPAGGFYAAQTAVDASLLAPLPPHLDTATAGGLPGAGLTARRGLEDVLAIGPGDADPDAELTSRLEVAVRRLKVELHVGGRYVPAMIGDAHAALERHHLGKLLLDTTELQPGGA